MEEASPIIERPWREPADVLAALGDQPWTLGLLSGGSDARWSYVLAEPDETLTIDADDPRDPFDLLKALATDVRPPQPEGPPFQGGVAGLLSYDLGDRVEPLGLGRLDDWPDVACARYSRVLAFDHADRRILAFAGAQAWLDLPIPPHPTPRADLAPDPPALYEAAVANVVERIRDGEFFQTNIARRWRGRLAPGADPVDLTRTLATNSPAPFAAYLRLTDRALISNSPERFVQVEPQSDGRLLARAQPITGTAPRGATPDQDAASAAALSTSAKDRAENLMIVDLMRNDLARVCVPGEVRVPELFALKSFANVHHLISTVTGMLRKECDAFDLLRAAFPPGSITGAPKVQAMKRIAALEAPRGPFFGSIFYLGGDGRLDASVLIRTAAFVRDQDGWRIEARAGAGLTVDSDPRAERIETEDKMEALVAALAP